MSRPLMDTTAFVERVRGQRAAAGRPAEFDDEAVYRILDGLLAARRREVPNGGDAA